MPSDDGWIAVLLDGGLAKRQREFNPRDIGEPYPAMIELTKKLMLKGEVVCVLSGRGTGTSASYDALVQEWLLEHLGDNLAVVDTYDENCKEIIGVHCTQLDPVTGVRIKRPTGWDPR